MLSVPKSLPALTYHGIQRGQFRGHQDMKIDPTRRVSTPVTRKTAKAGKAGGSEFSKMLEGTDAPASVSETAPAASVDSILAIQQVAGDAGGKSRRAQEQAEEMLLRLEAIQEGLLFGSIPQSHLHELTRMVDRSREDFVDPRLSEILDDIELRARIELAKLGMSN